MYVGYEDGLFVCKLIPALMSPWIELINITERHVANSGVVSEINPSLGPIFFVTPSGAMNL